MTHRENPITELADGLRAAFADVAARTPLLAPVFSLILARLDLLLRRLESLFAAWQAGTVSPPRPAAPAASRVNTGIPVPPVSLTPRTRVLVARLRRPPAHADSTAPATVAPGAAGQSVERPPAMPHRARHHPPSPPHPPARTTSGFDFRPPGPNADLRLNRSV